MKKCLIIVRKDGIVEKTSYQEKGGEIMKKIRKKLLASVFLMMLGVLMAGAMTVSAATVPKKAHISPLKGDYYLVYDIASGYTIKNVKTNSKNLVAHFTERVLHRDEGSDELYSHLAIYLYAKKSGQYKLSFNICDAKGKVKKKCSVTVYAYKNQPFKSIKYGDMTVSETYLKNVASKSTGTFKVTMNSGYKLKKIKISTEESHIYGGMNYKTVKNGSRIKLVTSTEPDVHSSGSLDDDYYEDYLWDAIFSCTYIEIQYVDKYTKETCTTWRYIYYPQKN